MYIIMLTESGDFHARLISPHKDCRNRFETFDWQVFQAELRHNLELMRGKDCPAGKVDHDKIP